MKIFDGIPKSMKTELQAYGDEYLEFIRQAVQEKLEREENVKKDIDK